MPHAASSSRSPSCPSYLMSAPSVSSLDNTHVPLDLWLTFSRPNLEASYDGRKNWIIADKILFAMAIPANVVKFCRWNDPNGFTTAFHSVVVFIMGIIFSVYFLGLLYQDQISYEANREKMFIIYRFVFAIGASAIALLQTPAWFWVPSLVASRIFSQTPVPLLLMQSLHRLPFKRHVQVQLVCALISSVWVSNLCRACQGDENVDEAVNRMGWATEGFVVRMAVFGFPVKRDALQPGQFSCWLVGFFYHFWMGFFVPSIIVYVLDFFLRVSYLRRSLGWRASEELNVVRISRLLLIGLVSIVGTQVLWVVLKGLFGPSNFWRCS